jgi:protein-S-isoprenylcysteine O-methyltransferase Ste14
MAKIVSKIGRAEFNQTPADHRLSLRHGGSPHGNKSATCIVPTTENTAIIGTSTFVLRPSRIYDALMRLPILTWSSILTVSSIVSFERYIHQADIGTSRAVCTINLTTRLSVITYLIVIAGTAFTRLPALGKLRGAEPRISAVIGSFLITGLVLFPRRELSPTESVISTLLILAGNSLGALVLLYFRRSFSIMAEARRLVTSGPYRFIRHPLYLGEELAALGVLIQFLSSWTMGLLAVHLAFQLRRMRNEEIVLTDFFPEYSKYRANKFRLIPGVY